MKQQWNTNNFLNVSLELVICFQTECSAHLSVPFFSLNVSVIEMLSTVYINLELYRIYRQIIIVIIIWRAMKIYIFCWISFKICYVALITYLYFSFVVSSAATTFFFIMTFKILLWIAKNYQNPNVFTVRMLLLFRNSFCIIKLKTSFELSFLWYVMEQSAKTCIFTKMKIRNVNR